MKSIERNQDEYWKKVADEEFYDMDEETQNQWSELRPR